MNYECDSGRCCVATWTCATEKVFPCYNSSDCKDGEACYYHDISRAFCDLKSLQPTITTPKPSSYNHPRVTIDHNRYCLSDSECEEEEPCQDGQCAYNEDDSSITLWVCVPGAVIVSSSLIACVLMWGRGQGGGRPGEKGAGGVREAGDDGAGSRRKREKLRNIAQYYAIEKMQRGGRQQMQGGNQD